MTAFGTQRFRFHQHIIDTFMYSASLRGEKRSAHSSNMASACKPDIQKTDIELAAIVAPPAVL